MFQEEEKEMKYALAFHAEGKNPLWPFPKLNSLNYKKLLDFGSVSKRLLREDFHSLLIKRGWWKFQQPRFIALTFTPSPNAEFQIRAICNIFDQTL